MEDAKAEMLIADWLNADSPYARTIIMEKYL
jgi:hypothetical protein